MGLSHPVVAQSCIEGYQPTHKHWSCGTSLEGVGMDTQQEDQPVSPCARVDLDVHVHVDFDVYVGLGVHFDKDRAMRRYTTEQAKSS